MIDNTNGNYNQITYGYDAWGNQTTQTTWTGYATWNANPSTGVQTTTNEYDAVYHVYPTKVTNTLGQFIQMGYDYAKGVPTSLTDLNGNVTTATYDAFGRITSITRPDDASATLSMTYTNSYPFTTTITLNPVNYTVTRKYDGMGRQFYMDSGGTIMDTIYESTTVTKQSVPYSGTSPNLFTTTTINPSANSTTVTAPDNTSTTTSRNGLVTTVTDAKGYNTTSTADIWGQVIQVTPPTGPAVGYSYDVLGNLLTATRGGPTTTLTYDNAGRKKTMSDPDMGYWQYTYDALSNLKTQTDARGCMLTLGYDNLNRLTSKTSSGSGCGTQVNTSYGYDDTTNGNEGVGQRTSMTDASGTTSWMYDIRGRMTKETKVISGQSYSTEYAYTSADLLDWMKYPDNETVDYNYDSKMQLYSVIGSSPYVNSTTYDVAGRIDNRVLGNGLAQDFSYYNWNQQGGRLQNITVGSLQNLNYTYDNNGNITQIQNTISSETQTFGYDNLNRLTSANVTNGLAPYNESYTYDVVTGNLASKAGVNYTYDATHKHAVSNLSNGNTYVMMRMEA